MQEWREYCSLPHGLRIAHGLWGLFTALYLFLFIFYLVRGGLRLARLPYSRFRAGNVLHMWQTRVRKWYVHVNWRCTLWACIYFWNINMRITAAGFLLTVLGVST